MPSPAEPSVMPWQSRTTHCWFAARASIRRLTLVWVIRVARRMSIVWTTKQGVGCSVLAQVAVDIREMAGIHQFELSAKETQVFGLRSAQRTPAEGDQAGRQAVNERSGLAIDVRVRGRPGDL